MHPARQILQHLPQSSNLAYIVRVLVQWTARYTRLPRNSTFMVRAACVRALGAGIPSCSALISYLTNTYASMALSSSAAKKRPGLWGATQQRKYVSRGRRE